MVVVASVIGVACAVVVSDESTLSSPSSVAPEIVVDEVGAVVSDTSGAAVVFESTAGVVEVVWDAVLEDVGLGDGMDWDEVAAEGGSAGEDVDASSSAPLSAPSVASSSAFAVASDPVSVLSSEEQLAATRARIASSDRNFAKLVAVDGGWFNMGPSLRKLGCWDTATQSVSQRRLWSAGRRLG